MRLIIIIILLSICKISISQEVSNILVRNINYITSDSCYQLSLFNRDNGEFWFRNGFIDSIQLLEIDIINEDLSRKQNRLLIKEKDTILSVFSPKREKIDSIVEKQTKRYTDTDVINSLLIEAEFSYLLQKMKVRKSNQEILLLLPTDELNFSHKYTLLKLNLHNINEFNFYVYKFISEDIDGIKLSLIDSAIIPKKKIEKIRKSLDNIRNISYSDCLSPGNPWLLMCDNKEFLISNYCTRIIKKDSSNKVSRINVELKKLYYKYFRR